MMNIAWLEQSGELQDRDALIADLKAEGVAFFRYNWLHGEDDPLANVFATGKKSWSKGRECLYDAAVTGGFDYYMFVDDDLVFDVGTRDAIKVIKAELSALNPAVLTVASSTWQERFLQRYSDTVRLFATDLQLQAIKADLAAKSFPALFDGGWGTLWYPMFMANKRGGGGVVNVRSITIHNTRGNETGEYGGVENQNAQEMWRRSEAYMPVHARVFGRLVGFKLSMMLFNAVYAMQRLRRK
jgi:hypothetical protein